MLWQETDRTFTGTIVCFINVGRNNPIPAKFTKINAQRVPTASRLSIIFPTIFGRMTFSAMLTHVFCLNFNVRPLQMVRFCFRFLLLFFFDMNADFVSAAAPPEHQQQQQQCIYIFDICAPISRSTQQTSHDPRKWSVRTRRIRSKRWERENREEKKTQRRRRNNTRD